MYRLHSLNNNENYWSKVYISYINSFVQGIEYSVSSFTISDGVFGTCFFFGTGFHGLTECVALCIYFLIINYNNILINLPTGYIKTHLKKLSTTINLLQFNKETFDSINLKKEFLDWFIGFTDGEGNFNIKLTGLEENTFKNLQLTFQIGLHKDEIKTLEYIKNTLKCGHISQSKNRINYFVNDINSLANILLPLFDNVNLNSSKYHSYLLFKKATLLVANKQHFSENGKLEIINLQKEMQSMHGAWIPISCPKISITKYWLAGFIDAEATFSTNKYVPRFKLENHIRELELYRNIRNFLGKGNLLMGKVRKDRPNSNPVIILEVNKIQELKDVLIPLMYDNNDIILKTLKNKDFFLWLKLVDLYYKGYHTTVKGKHIFDAIKLNINKYRLITNHDLVQDKQVLSILDIDNLLNELYLSESPYIEKHGVRYYRNTNKFVSEGIRITVLNSSDNSSNSYNSLTECAESLNISRKKIRELLNSGLSYKGYTFVLN